MNTCLICNEKDFVCRPYGSRFNVLSNQTKIRICTTCGLGAADPLPDDTLLKDYYASDAYQQWHKAGDFHHLDPLPHYRAINRYDLLASHFSFKDIKSVLDFGAGSAVTLRTVKIRHPHVSTSIVELSKAYRTMLGNCNEIDQAYKEIPSDLPAQDLIILSGVLEHFVDPHIYMRKFRSILAEKGYLFIEVPNCPFPYYYDNKKAHIPHTLFLTKNSLLRIAKTHGFEVIYVGCIGMSIEETNVSNIHSIIRQSGDSYVPNEQGVLLRVILRKTTAI